MAKIKRRRCSKCRGVGHNSATCKQEEDLQEEGRQEEGHQEEGHQEEGQEEDHSQEKNN
jgi:hypothetical protein